MSFATLCLTQVHVFGTGLGQFVPLAGLNNAMLVSDDERFRQKIGTTLSDPDRRVGVCCPLDYAGCSPVRTYAGFLGARSAECVRDRGV